MVIAALAPSLDFVLKYRDEIFPGVPVVYGAVDRREVDARKLGPGVVGVPMSVDLAPTLDLALRLHPGTRRVFVVAGRSKTDAYWVGEARRAFRGYEGKVEFVYLTGLPLNDLLGRVATLPDRSVIYYLHVFEDGLGNTVRPGGRRWPPLLRGKRPRLRPLQHVPRSRDRRGPCGQLRGRGRERGAGRGPDPGGREARNASPPPDRPQTPTCSTGVS